MAGTGGSMMSGVLTAGRAESGFGVTLAGFHCPTREFGARLQDVLGDLTQPDRIAQVEDNGYITFVGIQNAYKKPADQGARLATFRREPHKFFSELSPFLKSIKAAWIESLALSESLGSVQLTLLYVPSPGMDAPGV